MEFVAFGAAVIITIGVIKVLVDEYTADSIYQASYIGGGFGIDGRTRGGYAMRRVSNQMSWFRA